MEQYCMGCMRKRPDNEKICPVCGWDHSSTGTVPYALPPKSVLHNGKYLVGKVLGRGGFGITYIGYNMSLQMKVAIKEYYPQNIVDRVTGTSSLTWYVTDEQRKMGREKFIKEARIMAKIKKIPNVSQVLDVFYQNNTAYIIMDFVEGETLHSRIQKKGVMGEKECMDLLEPAMKSLASANKQGLIHRDISPDNLMIDDENRVWIIDLGAAKELDANQLFQGGATQSQNIVKKGFSPIEQFLSNGKIGPWTDVYAFSATIYYAITGLVLSDAINRIEDPTIKYPTGTSKRMRLLLEKGLSMKGADRYQSIYELLDDWNRPDGKQCKKCGKNVPGDAAYCPYCATPLSDDVPPHQSSSREERQYEGKSKGSEKNLGGYLAENQSKGVLGISLGWKTISISYPEGKKINQIYFSKDNSIASSAITITDNGAAFYGEKVEIYHKNNPDAPLIFFGDILTHFDKIWTYKNHSWSAKTLLKGFCKFLKNKVLRYDEAGDGSHFYKNNEQKEVIDCVIALPTLEPHIIQAVVKYMRNENIFIHRVITQCAAIYLQHIWENPMYENEEDNTVVCVLDHGYIEMAIAEIGDGVVEMLGVVGEYIKQNEDIKSLFYKLLARLSEISWIKSPTIKKYYVITDNNENVEQANSILKIVRPMGIFINKMPELISVGCSVQAGKLYNRIVLPEIGILLLPLIPFSIGIKYQGSDSEQLAYNRLISNGTTIPTIKSNRYKLEEYMDEQGYINIYYSFEEMDKAWAHPRKYQSVLVPEELRDEKECEIRIDIDCDGTIGVEFRKVELDKDADKEEKK